MKKQKSEVPSYKGSRRPRRLRGLLALALTGVLAFSLLLGAVLSGARDQISGDPQVMIVLGCSVKPWGPSVLLQDRLDKALDYLGGHPDMTVVVSGGQGPDEPASEAQAMYDYLVANGVEEAHILKEERSHNTYENLRYSFDLLRETGHQEKMGQVLVVSNGFHLTRVRMLFDRTWEGTYSLSTLAAPSSHMPSRLKMYIREPLALVKSFLLDW